MNEVVIASAARSAVGSFGGSLSNIPVVELGTIVAVEAMKRASISPEQIDEVILGNVLQAGQGQNTARQVSIHAGIPIETPSFTINKVCASGMKSIMLAAQAIKAGDAEIILAGGMENMSAAPYLIPKARFGHRMGDGSLIDSMVHDGLFEIFNKYHMGITAENIAEQFNITRQEQDEFALASQHKAQKAIESGRFKDEIVPVEIPQRKGDPIIFDTDEHPRAGTTLEMLSKLKPAFKKDGTVTAGNASGINDSAACLIIMSLKKAEELGIEYMVRIKSYATAGVDPKIMGTGPIPASKLALSKAGINVNDLDLIEANEAFASQSIAVNRTLGWDMDKVNLNGGAIALGHPIGASGARILTTLLYEMEKKGSQTGLATLCIGGGQGAAIIIEK